MCYNRQLKVVAYGDEFTKKHLGGEDSSNKYVASHAGHTAC